MIDKLFEDVQENRDVTINVLKAYGDAMKVSATFTHLFTFIYSLIYTNHRT